MVAARSGGGNDIPRTVLRVLQRTVLETDIVSNPQIRFLSSRPWWRDLKVSEFERCGDGGTLSSVTKGHCMRPSGAIETPRPSSYSMVTFCFDA